MTPRSIVTLLCWALVACGTVKSGLARCPSWLTALSMARRIAACGNDHRALPDSRCVAAIRRCQGGCDICRFLGGPNELKITVAGEEEWAPITRVPIDSEHLNGYDGRRAEQSVGFFSREYKLNWYLCNDESFGDVLASTIVHEAMHACASVNAPGIWDYRFPHPPGCSAEELENICASK